MRGDTLNDYERYNDYPDGVPPWASLKIRRLTQLAVILAALLGVAVLVPFSLSSLWPADRSITAPGEDEYDRMRFFSILQEFQSDPDSVSDRDLEYVKRHAPQAQPEAEQLMEALKSIQNRESGAPGGQP